MQPYQEASEEMQRQGKVPLKIAGTAASLAATAGGSALLSRVVPFLSKYIPQDMAIKGLSRVDPRFGDFINKAMGAGKSFDEVKDFIKEKAGVESEGQKEAPDQRNILEKYSPELFEFLKKHIDSGRSPLEAGALAQLDTKFNSVIKKLETYNKTPFSSILASIFGQGNVQPKQGNVQPNQSNAPQQQPNVQPKQENVAQRMTRLAQGQGQQQKQPNVQQNGGDAALLQALDKILKM